MIWFCLHMVHVRVLYIILQPYFRNEEWIVLEKSSLRACDLPLVNISSSNLCERVCDSLRCEAWILFSLYQIPNSISKSQIIHHKSLISLPSSITNWTYFVKNYVLLYNISHKPIWNSFNYIDGFFRYASVHQYFKIIHTHTHTNCSSYCYFSKVH